MTKEDLKTMQSWSLERKIQVTQTRIMEWYTHYNGQVYVSFSGGKDSTVLLDLARRIYPEILAVYIDTGLEYPEIKEFVKSFNNVTIIRPEMNFKKVIEKYGYPLISKEIADAVSLAKRGFASGEKKLNGVDKNGNPSTFRQGNKKYNYLIDAPFLISDECCHIMKKKPSINFEKTGLKPIIATMAEESMFRQTGWLQTGCNAFNAKRPQSKPMSFWTEQDVLEYLKRFNVPYCSVYGDIVEDIRYTPKRHIPKPTGKLKMTGCRRTGCVFCGFGCHLEKEPNRFQRLKQTHPKLHEYCMKPIEDGGLGMREVLEFIDVKSE